MDTDGCISRLDVLADLGGESAFSSHQRHVCSPFNLYFSPLDGATSHWEEIVSLLRRIYQIRTFYQDGRLGKQDLLPIIISVHHFWATFLEFSFSAAGVHTPPVKLMHVSSPFISPSITLFSPSFLAGVRADHCWLHDGRLKVRRVCVAAPVFPGGDCVRTHTTAPSLLRGWLNWRAGDEGGEGSRSRGETLGVITSVEPTWRCEELSQKSF